MPETDVSSLLTYRQAAKRLNVSDRTVWSLVKNGDLPAVRFPGALVRIDPRDLDQFIAQRKETRQ